MGGKGQTLEKVYTKSVPTVVVWDPSYEDHRSSGLEDGEGEGDQVWEGMQGAEDDGDSRGDGESEESGEELQSTSLHKKSRRR